MARPRDASASVVVDAGPRRTISGMDVLARVTTRGRVTLPKELRAALKIEPGDAVRLWHEAGELFLERIPRIPPRAENAELPPDQLPAP